MASQTYTANQSNWTPPVANGESFTVQAWGGGGAGAGSIMVGGYGGGGGAYAQVTIEWDGVTTYELTVGAGGTAGGPGGDTALTSNAAMTTHLLAKGGTNSTGGQAASCVGDTKFSGGDGGAGDLEAPFGSGHGGGGGRRRCRKRRRRRRRIRRKYVWAGWRGWQ